MANPFEGMTEQQLADLRKYAEWANNNPEAAKVQQSTAKLEQTHEAGGKTTTKDLQDWWTGTYNLWRSNPSGFQEWAKSYPDMATRWYGLAQTEGQNLTRADGKPVTNADIQAEQIQHMVSNGVDFKRDGALYTFNYKMVDDVNSEWGGGDFWKLASYNTPKNGVMGTIQNVVEDPQALAMIAASIFLPMAAPALVTALGVTPAVASGIISSGLTAVGGGDFKEVLVAGLSAYGLSRLNDLIPQVLDSVSPEAAQTWTDIQKFTTEGGLDEVAEEAGARYDIWGRRIYNGVQAGIDEARENDYMPGDLPRNPNRGSLDMPILDYPGGGTTVKPPGASGSPVEAPPSAPPATPTPTTPSSPTSPTAPSTGSQGPSGGLDNPDVYVWNGSVLVNTRDGSQVSLPRVPAGMQTGGRYNRYGEPIGDKPEESGGLVLGPTWPIFGNIGNTPTGTPTGGTGTTPGGTGTVNGGGTTPGGTGTTPGGTGGTGTGPGPGTGTGQEGTGEGPDSETKLDFDISKLIPLLAFAPQNDNNPLPQGNARPQDMSTRYQRPVYAPVQQKSLLEPLPDNQRRVAPPILPAQNSNQPSYSEWYRRWLQNQEGGSLLPATPQGGLV